jgi:hypothetical protein
MRRFANLNNVAKAAIAATAMLVVAVVGITLVSPSSSPAATAQPGPSRTAASAGPASRRPFRQTVTEKGVRFSIRVPRYWEPFSSIPTKKSPQGPISLNRSYVGAQGAEAIIYWTSFPDGDYADPCARELAPSIGQSAANLAAAVSTAPGTKLVKGPLDVTLGGHPAKHVVLTVRKSVGCNPGFFYTWRDGGFGGAFWRTTDVGDTIRVWIVPVGGTRLFIAAATREGANKQEVKQIVESIRFVSVVRTS